MLLWNHFSWPTAVPWGWHNAAALRFNPSDNSRIVAWKWQTRREHAGCSGLRPFIHCLLKIASRIRGHCPKVCSFTFKCLSKRLKRQTRIDTEWWKTYLVPFWGERGRFLKPLFASAAIGNRLATVPQSSLLLIGRWNEQVRVRLGEAACQLQVSRRARSDGGRCPGPRVLGLLMHCCINGFWITVCQDGSHVGTAVCWWNCRHLLLYFGECFWFRMLLAGHLDTRKPEDVFTAVKDGGRSVQEAGKLLRDTCSLLLAGLGVVWKNRNGMGKKSVKMRRFEGWREDL